MLAGPSSLKKKLCHRDDPPPIFFLPFFGAMVDVLVRSNGTALAAAAPSRFQKRKTTPTFDSLHEGWLHALRTADGRLIGKEEELVQLASQIQNWRRPLDISITAPFRLCFRLEEPPGEKQNQDTILPDQGAWHVRFLLQAEDDPSLIIPAQDAWSVRGQQAKILQRGNFNPREYLLAALGSSRFD